VNGIVQGVAAGIVTGVTFCAAIGLNHPTAQPVYATQAATTYGNPLAGAPWWFPQTQPDCVEATASILIAEKTGAQPVEATLDSQAQKLGIYTPGVGSTDITHLGSLYGEYGVKVTVGSHSLGTLENDLAAGRGVAAFVNGPTLWVADGFAGNAPSNTPDHAVVVDAVAGGFVTLTDTGIDIPMARTETVSLGVFKQAWSTSGYDLVVTS
jgi:hypothetical protein